MVIYIYIFCLSIYYYYFCNMQLLSFFLLFFLAIVYNCICIDVFVDLLLMSIKSSNIKKKIYWY